jgi:hypothetical protein
VPRYTQAEIEKMRADGRRGGKTAAANMTPEQRSERARKAVQTRWAQANANAIKHLKSDA